MTPDARADPTPQPSPRILAVSVNFRTGPLAVNLLTSLSAERETVPELEAVLVDNDSGDGSLACIEAGIRERGFGGWVRLVAAPRNGGFAFGNNLATRHALASDAPPDYVLYVNPDVEVQPGALGALLAFLEAHPRVGIVGPATEIGRGSLRGTAFRFPGIVNSFDEGLHLGLVSRLCRRWQLQPAPRAEPHRTDWVSGGCMLVRRAVFDDVGLMDEGYFLYYEELDFTLAASRKGWETWYVPAARVVHFAGASTGLTGGHELARRIPRFWFESRRRYFVKNRGPVVACLADLAWLAGNSLWNVRRFLTRAPRKEPPHFFGDFLRFNFLGR
jgi:GT2 family glycosyltransferase